MISAEPGASSAPAFSARWDRAMQRLRPRGPDGVGDWSSDDGRVRLGHTRLAIVDLSDAGAQPMGNEDGAVVVSFNGEIYNARSLRKELESAGHRFASGSDTEVIVHGYEQWGGRGVLDRLRGMFAFVIWDARKSFMLACVDHAAMKPLCFTQRDGALLLASTTDAIVELADEQPILDGTSLCHVLCHGYVPGGATVWKGVRRLGPGELLEWTPGRGEPRCVRWWEPTCQRERGEKSDPDEFAGIWTEVVRDHLVSDVPVRLLLSGGLDSTAVAAAIAGMGERVDCLTLALDGDDDESAAAAETAQFLGLRHEVERLGATDVESLMDKAAELFDEPQGYGALLTMTRVAEAARRGGKVVLAGDGGDEAFAGYTWHHGEIAAQEPDTRHAELSRLVSSPDTNADVRWRALAALSTLSFVHAHAQRVAPRMHPTEAATLLAPFGAEYDERQYVAPFEGHDDPGLPWPRRAQRLDLAGFCAGSILPKVDRATMGFGLELRAPFLDRRVLEWALSRPVEEAELGAHTGKPVLRRYLAGRAPKSVLQRPKQGFSLRTGGAAMYEEMLERLRESSMVRDGYLCERWESFVGPGVPYREQRIFTLAMLGAWMERRLPCASRS